MSSAFEYTITITQSGSSSLLISFYGEVWWYFEYYCELDYLDGDVDAGGSASTQVLLRIKNKCVLKNK